MNKSIHSPEYQTLLRLLREVREASGLTQAQVAAALDEPQSWVSRVETGETRIHAVELWAYCRAIGLAPAEFMARLDAALD